MKFDNIEIVGRLFIAETIPEFKYFPMSSKNNLEIKGNLLDHPLAELLVEISQITLNGSLRIEHENNKAVIYFDAGDVVFAVSNSRRHRLYEILLRDNKITKEGLSAIPDFTNDFVLCKNLSTNGHLSRSEADELFSQQIKEIISDMFDWSAGNWIFSPLVRVKGDIRFKINLGQNFMEYARKQTDEMIMRRFKSVKEVFRVCSSAPVYFDMLPEEAFVFSRFEKSELSLEKISALSGLPEIAAFRILYLLWLSGFVSRGEWNCAFGEKEISTILSTRYTLKTNEEPATVNLPERTVVDIPANQAAEQEIESEINAPPRAKEKLTLEDYLDRIENADNYYEILDIETEAGIAEIKSAYFNLAKKFHPDLFHKEKDTQLVHRIQNAFTVFAQAYETLKNDSQREVYDYKIRKEAVERGSKPQVKGKSGEVSQEDQAAESFAQGFDLLMNSNYEAALPFLARAVHYLPNNARHHAYYGKVLANDKKNQHKAEAELQTAIRLEPENTVFRIMLAEFFVEIGLIKRAEGELNRLLAIFPTNKEAQVLLDSLSKR